MSELIEKLQESRKRTRKLFQDSLWDIDSLHIEAKRLRTNTKIHDEYRNIEEAPPTAPSKPEVAAPTPSNALIAVPRPIPEADKKPSAALVRSGFVPEKPAWHPPWILKRVISGHLGWVRCIAVDVGNQWFVTGSADRLIKIWDLASGQLKLTLTGHIGTVRSLVVSPRHPYLFSAADDKTVRCWDLEMNKVVRHYHGHLSGVYCASLHPTLDILVTGGRDSAARIWDVRTKAAIHVLGGHTNTVWSVLTQATEPQVVTGSSDATIKLWDIRAGRCQTTLTHHKKAIRALVAHRSEYTFASAGADHLKKWKCPEGLFMHNFMALPTPNEGSNASHPQAPTVGIINTLALNSDNVLVSGGDDGTITFWDWSSGFQFQKIRTTVQPGSLECEAAVYAACFDQTGSRLLTCEGDKTIKVWKEDEDATPETHPVQWSPDLAFALRDLQRY